MDSALGDCDCPGQPCKDVQADQDTYCPDIPKGKFLLFVIFKLQNRYIYKQCKPDVSIRWFFSIRICNMFLWEIIQKTSHSEES